MSFCGTDCGGYFASFPSLCWKCNCYLKLVQEVQQSTVDTDRAGQIVLVVQTTRCNGVATSEFLVKIKFLSCGRATYYIYSQRRQMAMKYYEVPRLLHRLFKWSEDSSVGFQMYVL